jgi:hypothetical protein
LVKRRLTPPKPASALRMFSSDAKLMRHRDRGGGVERVVAPRHRQVSLSMVCVVFPARSRNNTVKREPPPSW